MEGVFSVAAVTSRLRKRANHLDKLKDRTRPAVAEQDRQGVLMPGAHVQKMDAQAIDLCTVLAETVEHRLATAPVIFCSPVVYQREDPRQRYALRPVGNRLAVWPPRHFKTALEVVERALRHVDFKGRYQ